MKQLYKIALLIGLLVLSVGSLVLADSSRDIIISKVYESMNLDKSSYTVEVLTDEIKSRDFSFSQVSVKPLYETTPIGRFAIVLKVTRTDGKIEKQQIRLFIRKYAEVAAANERIKRFAEVSSGNVSIQRKEITTLREEPITTLKLLTNMRARRNIAKDNVLTKSNIELIPMVKSYSDVHIVYVDGLCRVSAEGKALQDGHAGAMIRVKNKSSGKVVFARVVDKNSVVVDP